MTLLPRALRRALPIALLASLCLVPVSGHPAAAAARVTARTISIVALGDSVPAGVHCACTPFPQLYAARVAAATGARVTVTNDAVSGSTSMRTYLASLTSTQKASLRSANVVLVMVGANDTPRSLLGAGGCADVACYRAQLHGITAHLVSLILHLRGLHHVPGQRIVLVNYWNVWQDGAVGRARGAAYVTASRRVTLAVNNAIYAAAHPRGLPVISLLAPFGVTTGRDDTALLAADGDHPSAVGHRVIARAITDQVPRLLAP